MDTVQSARTPHSFVVLLFAHFSQGVSPKPNSMAHNIQSEGQTQTKRAGGEYFNVAFCTIKYKSDHGGYSTTNVRFPSDQADLVRQRRHFLPMWIS